ncbi:c-type cytochrome domain-containing protein [Sorangium sp. So ce388]|uniref:c-type cytochrome domain-containing protein n=1 Tax=Sorangium sp. So ce388 TaxID=3133309 RepID=UPI003F5B53A9
MTSLHGRAALTAGALLTGGALLMSCAGTLDDDEFPPDEQGSGGGVTQGAGTPAATTGGGGTPAATTGGDAAATTTATTGGDAAATTTAAAGGEPTGCAEAPALVTSKCATAGCHDANSKQAGLSLASGWENAVRGKESACGGGASVLVPGDPDASTVYTKVTPTPSCNNRMPLGGQPLSDTEIACIRDFIAALTP